MSDCMSNICGMDGNYCSSCAKDRRIEELQFELSSYEESDANLQKKVKELEEKLAGKPAYHCPKCDSWFSEEALEQKDEPHK